MRVSHRPRCLKIFEETAENEKQHAKDHLQLLNGIGDTATNLKEAMGGKDYEIESMYPEFAKIAEEEGETAAAITFKQVAKIEAHHRERYKNDSCKNFFVRNAAIIDCLKSVAMKAV